MAFDDLTESQKALTSNLVEELASGNYHSEIWALATLGQGWFLTLKGIGGAQSKEIGGLEETDLHALNNEGYITLIPKQHGYTIGLKPRAYQQYKLSKQPEVPQMEEPQTGTTTAARTGAFDEAQLDKIATNSEDLLEELRQNYNLSRSQSAMWFKWTLAVSIFGFVLLGMGVILIFGQLTAPAIINSTAGVLTEFLALVFFRQASEANKRQDQYHRDLLRRQQILDAVQLARLISQEPDRDRITETIIQSLLGIDQK